MDNATFSSPDGNHVLTLKQVDEIRHGPACYAADLDGRAVPKLVFGRHVLWSPDSLYAALQLWNTTDDSAGPDTSLFVIDTEHSACWHRSRCRGGFIEPHEWQGSLLLFDRSHYGMVQGKSFEVGRVRHGKYDIDLATVTGWKPLFAE